MNRTTRDRIRRYLEAFDFAGLFTDPDLGWDWPDSKGKLRVPTKSGFIDTEVIADKRGVKVLHLAGLADGQIPASDERKAIEKAVTPLATEHLLIFTDKAKIRQVWLWTSRYPGKPISYRELTWEKGKSNELLLQKLASIAFTISEEESLDITGVVARLRDSLDRDKVTKKFYEQFKTQKDAFRKFIKGISDGGLWDWYTSLMLNRLMFCYFLQRKGFLDGDLNYLSNRLDRVRDEFGKEKFHSFYKSFLRRLFHEGLGAPKDERAADLKKLIGEVPYLNGGIFEEHKIERDHPGLHIPDEAFEKVFRFLDQFDWHLDDRPIAKGNEINPEILGYVFEKYTNQKEMGAYYTKEDITDYIAKNCIIPFLLDAAGDKLGDASWNLLRDDLDRYIYPAVAHGVFCDYPTNTKLDAPLSLLDYIERGIDTSKPDLRKRRARWNESATPDLGLPTEIWRETVARRQRCEELQRKLRAGEVRAVNDLITLNLNVRQFAQDVVENAAPDLLLALFKAIRKVSVLDPTCGSGAFLFAALNILEPLYRASLDRMRTLLGDWEARGDKSHPNYRKEFSAVLDQAARHPNENYFIFKSIIVHNLYGVDIMEEAVEICKLRLFLKLAAQLEPGQEIEPLPDIDFNIRAGNTLVGYVSRDEVQEAFSGGLKGVEHTTESFEVIEERAQFLDNLFGEFQRKQDDFGTRASDLREAKMLFEQELKPLHNDLDHFLAADYDMRNVADNSAFINWRDSHQPFHWFVEFYGILNCGGFDVIIGNPPYVEYSKVNKVYRVIWGETPPTNNLFALVSERARQLLKAKGSAGLILPNSSVSAEKMKPLQQVLRTNATCWVSSFAWRPSKLFEGANMLLAIWLIRPCEGDACYTTRYHRWQSDFRQTLFPTIQYLDATTLLAEFRIPKLPESLAVDILTKCRESANGNTLSAAVGRGTHRLYYFRAVLYWFKVLTKPPVMEEDGIQTPTGEMKELTFAKSADRDAALTIMASNLFALHYVVWSSCQVVNSPDLRFPVNLTRIVNESGNQLSQLATALMEDVTRRSELQTRNYSARGRTFIMRKQYFFFKKSKPIIDEIDAVLAKHYGFTEEELDFIINYDIKYRMGLSDGSAGDTDE